MTYSPEVNREHRSRFARHASTTAISAAIQKVVTAMYAADDEYRWLVQLLEDRQEAITKEEETL